ncbi:pilus assembly FimT family protein [Sulfoacidibacillus thermotolerans]|uniref:General secretion pathway GspH domain-containing protein n=1 Tax=Sulfoacidibacillus thermotolerans TaxID=1765684 RepID=A0A2U3DC05_SULT2|nr:type II secretion system protein [Sulfoacidibacillus thermotolerans]PWI58810.1 hypothetical protein BM613_01585 [Sulfoacidibacillus thermotolerans]
MTDDFGYSLLEILIGLMIFAMLSALVLPNVTALLDSANLHQTALQVLSDLRMQQLRAEEFQAYQEVRFAPFAPYYFLYGNSGRFEKYQPFSWPTDYYDGYLHLPNPTVRFDDLGNVSESGQIAFTDPLGGVQNIVLYLQYGDMRMTTHMLLGK